MPDATTFWTAYLAAVVFWLGTSLGCLAIALLHGVTGGRWGHVIGRELRAGIAAGAVGLIAAIPLAFAAPMIYPGAGSESSGALNAHQRQYFDPIVVAARAGLAVIVWAGLGIWLLRTHVARSRDPDRRPSPRKAALGLIAFWLTATFAIVDGVLALMPGWFSSLFPVLEIVGFAVAGMALAIIVRRFQKRDAAWTEEDRQRTHDLGNMLQAFNLVWVYLAFSQYLIIWSGDLPHEVNYYLDRRDPIFAAGTIALFALHFVVPFGLLLSRDLKRNANRLACIAGLLLMMRLVAIGWTILPTTDGVVVGAILMLVLSAAIGFVWLLLFRAACRRLPENLVPGSDHSAVRTHPNSATGEA